MRLIITLAFRFSVVNDAVGVDQEKLVDFAKVVTRRGGHVEVHSLAEGPEETPELALFDGIVLLPDADVLTERMRAIQEPLIYEGTTYSIRKSSRIYSK